MISKIFVLFTSFFHHDTVEVKVHPVVSVPEDEIVIENIRPELASMYY
jgi:hypothetical protein